MPQVSAAARPTTVTSSTASTTALSHCEDGDGKQELCPGSGVYIPMPPQSWFGNESSIPRFDGPF